MEKMWINPPANLAEALKATDDPAALVRNLLQAARHGVATSTERNGYWSFKVDPDENSQATDLKLTPDKTLSGASRDQLETVYQVVRGIETELTEATLLPPHMRQARITRFCERLGISVDFFSSILQNWEKPNLQTRT